jgi:hypothetical protein
MAGADHPGLRRQAPWHFDRDNAARALCAQFGVRDLNGFGCVDQPVAVAAAGCLLQYVKDTQRSALPHLTGLRVERHEDSVILDAASRRNLELEHSLSGHHEHTLIGLLDRCVTPMGGRLLRRWLHRRCAIETRSASGKTACGNCWTTAVTSICAACCAGRRRGTDSGAGGAEIGPAARFDRPGRRARPLARCATVSRAARMPRCYRNSPAAPGFIPRFATC